MDAIQEIANIEHAMDAVETSVLPGAPLGEHLLRGLHAMTVQGLEREGDKTPGAYRTTPVRIAQADHLPPDAPQVPVYMDELVAFVNRSRAGGRSTWAYRQVR